MILWETWWWYDLCKERSGKYINEQTDGLLSEVFLSHQFLVKNILRLSESLVSKNIIRHCDYLCVKVHWVQLRPALWLSSFWQYWNNNKELSLVKPSNLLTIVQLQIGIYRPLLALYTWATLIENTSPSFQW